MNKSLESSTKKKVILFWSGGKDSALSLYELKNDKTREVVGLLTTIDKVTNRVRFQGADEHLIGFQAKMLNLPLQRVYLPHQCSNEEYIAKLSKVLGSYKKAGVEEVVFGDINQEEIKTFRKNFLNHIGLKAHFPLWGQSTQDLAKKFIETNHRAVVVSFMSSKIPPHDHENEKTFKWASQNYSTEFLKSLPVDIDPCGENGEFHTFVYYGPYFKTRVSFSSGIIKEDGPYQVLYLQSQ